MIRPWLLPLLAIGLVDAAWIVAYIVGFLGRITLWNDAGYGLTIALVDAAFLWLVSKSGLEKHGQV